MAGRGQNPRQDRRRADPRCARLCASGDRPRHAMTGGCHARSSNFSLGGGDRDGGRPGGCRGNRRRSGGDGACSRRWGRRLSTAAVSTAVVFVVATFAAAVFAEGFTAAASIAAMATGSCRVTPMRAPIRHTPIRTAGILTRTNTLLGVSPVSLFVRRMNREANQIAELQAGMHANERRSTRLYCHTRIDFSRLVCTLDFGKGISPVRPDRFAAMRVSSPIRSLAPQRRFRPQGVRAGQQAKPALIARAVMQDNLKPVC